MTGIKKRQALIPLAVCLLCVLASLLLYRIDNKYTAPGAKGRSGILALSGEELAERPVHFLSHGWEFYGDRLLAPEDFADVPPLPDAHIFLGQYGGFDGGQPDRSPHGSASYRITLFLPEEPQVWALELPEIFSAYRLYMNSVQIAGMGNPGPEGYRPETGNRVTTFHAGGQVELLVAVSDYSHLYSGMVYPPAFGAPEAVDRLLNTRLAFRLLLCAAALTVGLLSLLVGWLGRARGLPLWYGLLCLLFVGYVGYPLWNTFFRGTPVLYLLENFCFCAMLTVAACIQVQLCGENSVTRRAGRWAVGSGLFVCAVTVAVHLTLPMGLLPVMMGYSHLITLFQWVTASFLTVTAVCALVKGPVSSAAVLCGVLAVDCALVMDRLLPLYEPIVTGWFIELASFAMVLCIGIATGQEVAGQYRRNTVLEERTRGAEQLVRVQQVHYNAMREQVEATNAARHDLRHHMLAIGGMVRAGDYTELEEYLQGYAERLPASGIAPYCENQVVNLLLHSYAHSAGENSIRFDVRAEVAEGLPIPAADLCALLSNLLENAVEACLRMEAGRFIRVAVGQKEAALSLSIENSAGEGLRKQGGIFRSAKAEDRIGYGLASIRTIARRYGGDAEFAYDRGCKVFFSTVWMGLE